MEGLVRLVAESLERHGMAVPPPRVDWSPWTPVDPNLCLTAPCHPGLFVIAEQMVPFLQGFEYAPKDARFLGSPVDLVVFDGLSAGEVRRVVFVEVKTGGASLTTRERQVRAVIEAREVAWAELRLTRTQG